MLSWLLISIMMVSPVGPRLNIAYQGLQKAVQFRLHFFNYNFLFFGLIMSFDSFEENKTKPRTGLEWLP